MSDYDFRVLVQIAVIGEILARDNMFYLLISQQKLWITNWNVIFLSKTHYKYIDSNPYLKQLTYAILKSIAFFGKLINKKSIS